MSPEIDRLRVYPTDDNALVFTLQEALSEIRALRSQKRLALAALKFVSGNVGGAAGERAADALYKIREATR